VPEGCIPPRWIGGLLFPVLEAAANNNVVQVDYMRRVLTIYGMRYSFDFFEALSEQGLPVGESFTVVERSPGIVTIERREGL